MRRFRIFLFLIIFLTSVRAASACDGCGCTLARLGHADGETEKRFFTDFTFEGRNWNSDDARAAHELHHQGHHVHNKTHEEFYHFAFGFNPNDSLTLLAEIPWVRISSTEIDTHARLGRKEVSEGLGDLDTTLTWRFWKEGGNFLGAVGGVKFPTGSTSERSSGNVKFEPELQPGSGSYDTRAGLAFRYEAEEWRFHGNALYTLKSEGDQDFEYGDVLSSYLVVDRPLVPALPGWRAGIDLQFLSAQRDREAGLSQKDSGGETLLVGPSVTWEAGPSVSLFGNFLLPAYQELGGVHQEIDFVWNAGCKILW